MTFTTNTRDGQSSTAVRLPGSAKLRAYLADPTKIIICPGVFDGLTARMALKAGFDSLYMTGAGTSMSRLGMADLGLANLHEMRTNAEMIASIDHSVPVIADADTGYGGSLMVGRTTAEYIRSGVAGFHLEDQVLNKRCGHLAGKELVDDETYLARIQAAVRMREQMGSDIVIIARTDALQSLGLDVAIARAQKAVAAGADVVFIEALDTAEQGRKVCEIFARTNTPVMYNLVQGGRSPILSVKEAQEIGFKILAYSSMCLLPFIESVTGALETLKGSGLPPKTKGSPEDAFRICGFDELMAFDKAVAAPKPRT